MGSGDKKTTTVRLPEAVMADLQEASRILKHSQSQIMEDALEEYFTNHKLRRRYVVVVHGEYTVLTLVEGIMHSIVSISPTNGLSPEELARRYASQLHAPVTLEISNGGARL